jgi:hypothetical protein
MVQEFGMASLEQLKESLRSAKAERDRLNRSWWQGSAAKRKEELERIEAEIHDLERRISDRLVNGG